MPKELANLNTRVSTKHLPWSGGSALPSTAKDIICLVCCKSTLLTHVQPSVHQEPQVSLCQTAFQAAGPSGYCCLGLLLLSYRTLRFPLSNFVMSLTGHFSSMSRFPWMVAHQYGLPAIPPNFISSINLLQVHFAQNSGR